MQILYLMLFLLALTLSHPPLVNSGGIDLRSTIDGLNVLLDIDEIKKELGGVKHKLSYMHQLQIQANSCAIWILQDMDDARRMKLSPQIKNKDPNVVFLRERFYKNHTHSDNSLCNDELPPNTDAWNINIHYTDYTTEDQVKAAACSSLMNDKEWLINGVKSGLKGIGGYIREHTDYFLVVFAFQVRAYHKKYLSIPDLDLDPPVSNSVLNSEFEEVVGDELVLSVEPSRFKNEKSET